MDEESYELLPESESTGESDTEEYDLDESSDELFEDISAYIKAKKSFKLLDLDNNCSKVIVVPDDERTTSQQIQRYEMVEAIGIRATQIEQGAPVLTDVEGLTDPITMAKKEFFDRRNPLTLTRSKINNRQQRFKLVEEWKVREMTFPHTFRKMDFAKK